MKYFIAIFVAVFALRCYGNNYNRRNNPSYMLRINSQIQQDNWNEDNNKNFESQTRQKILITLTHKNRYNQYVQNQTSYSNESKQRRAKHINNSSPFYSNNNRQRRIGQTSDNESFSRNNRISQLRQVKSKLTRGLFNEFDNSADGRMNPMSSGDFVGRNNTAVRNSNNFGGGHRNPMDNRDFGERNNTGVRNYDNFVNDRRNPITKWIQYLKK